MDDLSSGASRSASRRRCPCPRPGTPWHLKCFSLRSMAHLLFSVADEFLYEPNICCCADRRAEQHQVPQRQSLYACGPTPACQTTRNHHENQIIDRTATLPTSDTQDLLPHVLDSSSNSALSCSSFSWFSSYHLRVFVIVTKTLRSSSFGLQLERTADLDRAPTGGVRERISACIAQSLEVHHPFSGRLFFRPQ
jgi:hypothetical protein